MSISISHLPGISSERIRTARLETQILSSGPPNGEPVLFLHGNLSGATFWEETMLALPDRFRAVAPDQRGYGSSDPSAIVDATRGVRDWDDDAASLADQLGWSDFHLVAHSLGGCVAWSILGSHPERLRSVTLVAPGPPCGFGGARGLNGELNHADGAGSGARLVDDLLTKALLEGCRNGDDDLFAPRAVMNRAYWKPPFRPAREEQLLNAMLQVHLGERQFPGDWTASPHWPGFAPGRFGPVNALSPRYNQAVLERLRAARQKPRLLWIYGEDDVVVSDASMTDAGQQGKLGLRGDWPGADVFPPQPLLSQVLFALGEYEETGGTVRRLVLADVGHTPYLERPAEFQSALIDHLQAG